MRMVLIDADSLKAFFSLIVPMSRPFYTHVWLNNGCVIKVAVLFEYFMVILPFDSLLESADPSK